PHRFLSIDDAGLARGLLSSTPHWTAPALVFPTGELTVGHDALIGLLLAIAAIAAHSVHKHIAAGSLRDAAASTSPSLLPVAAPALPIAAPALPIAAWPILGLAIAIGLPFLDVADRDGLGFRLRIAAFVPAALCAAIAVRTALGAARAVLARRGRAESAAQ